MRARLSSWYQKAKDSAVGSSFDQHVVGGYRFLMRFYNPGDEIYMFGFSRGAYIARFLAEMLDYIGLLSHGNEEMVKFAWKAFAEWQSRPEPTGSEDERAEVEAEKEKMYKFMKGFRETFSRPVGRIRFLGLFDTVNSVPRFETAWMQRSRFPYTARSSAKVIRHAVSIDERRAKFRQDLMYQARPQTKHHHHHHRPRVPHLGGYFDAASEPVNPDDEKSGPAATQSARKSVDRSRRPSQGEFLVPNAGGNRGEEEKYGPYRSRSRSRQASVARPISPDVSETASIRSMLPPSEIDPEWEDGSQDIDEIWFSGGHGDVGGGWEALQDRKSSSHVPLAWIVREATKAGLPFDTDKVKELGCFYEPSRNRTTAQSATARIIPKVQIDGENEEPESPTVDDTVVVINEHTDHPSNHQHTPFHAMMHKSHTARIHDSLEYGQGLPTVAVIAWKIMEHIPFRRMDLKTDGSWEPIRWPLPRGEVRDIPDNVRIHGSVIRRMKDDPEYRPGNLIIGGGGRGVRRAPSEHGIGEWVCVEGLGDPIGEIWVRKVVDKVVSGDEEKQNGKQSEN